MIASSNAGYFVLGGEGKTAAEFGPPGSAQVAYILVEQLASTGIIARTTTFLQQLVGPAAHVPMIFGTPG